MLSHILRSYFKILLIDGQQTHYEIIVMIHKPIQESCSVAKMTARCALYMGALKILGVPDYAHGYFSQIFNGLLFGWTL